VLLRKNVQGNVYGATFIDNGTRTVFNGSDLGKAYGAKNFMERLGRIGISLGQLSELSTAASSRESENHLPGDVTAANRFPAYELPAIEILEAGSTAESLSQQGPVQVKKAKRNIRLE
jgi:hypothetical protein